MKLKEINTPITPEAQDTSIAQNQLLKIGNHAILLNNIINSQETDPWVTKKINLASNHVKKVHNYMAEYRQTVSPRDEAHYREMMKTLQDIELQSARDPETMAEVRRRKMELKRWAEQNLKREDDGKPIMRDPLDSEQAKDMAQKVDYANIMFRGKEIDHNSIEYEMQDFSDGMFELHGAKYIDGTDLNDQELEEFEHTDELQDWVLTAYASSGPEAPDDYQENLDERMPASIIKHKEKLAHMSDEELANRFKDKDETTLRQMAWRHGYGKMSSHYLDKVKNHMTSRRTGATEDESVNKNESSPLKETAKMAIELIEILKQGKNINDSIQSNLNLAADSLQAVYQYEGYRKANPYREELDSNTLNKHAQVIQNGIDGILARETPIDDVDTKPGMLRILGKKVNEVEKEMAKETRKETSYEESLQNQLDSAITEYDTPEKKAQRDALMKQYLAKGGKVEKIPTGKTAYKNKELKPAYKKDPGTPLSSPMSDESVEEEPGYYKNPDKEFNINGLTTKQDVVQSIIDNIDNNELDTARDSLNQLLDVVTALHEGGMPASIIKHKQKLAMMSDEELADRFKDFDEDRLRRMAWGHGYGKMSSHYLDRVRNHMTSKRTGTYESKLANMLNQRLK